MKIDKDFIKNNLTLEQVFKLLTDLKAEPLYKNNIIICKTICHHHINELDEASHKLYYYENSHLFKCFTDCGETFDIFELIIKVKTLEGEENYSLPSAISFIINYFNIDNDNLNDDFELRRDDFTLFENYDKINNIVLEKQIVELKEYSDNILKNLPKPIIETWINDGISKEVMDYYEICYDPKNCGIVIPHRDINGKLIGIRERTTLKENAELYGKYMPMKIGKQMFNHPISFSLFGIYQNKDNIKRFKKAIIVEAEKSVMQYATMFGQENNICVAICGSSFIQYQAQLLLELGVNEIIVALDRQYKEINDDEFKKLVKNLKNIHSKYGHLVKISFMFDKENLLPYKASPTDEGKDVFLKLYNNRVNLY